MRGKLAAAALIACLAAAALPAVALAVPATVTTSAGDTPYTEGESSAPVDNALTVSDTDDTNLEGATVRMSAGFQSADELVFTDTAQITATYNSGTGVLTLTGTATVAQYEAAPGTTSSPAAPATTRSVAARARTATPGSPATT